MATDTGQIPDHFYTPWWEADPCPDDCLCHSPSEEEIAKMVARTRPNPFFNHGVYVLECKARSPPNAEQVAWEELDISSTPWWVRAASASSRLIYVGLSKQMVTRITDHAHANENGGSFTKVFPPVRLLGIDWYPTIRDSYREEPKKADSLDEDLDAFVFQR